MDPFDAGSPVFFNEELADDSKKLLESAIALNLEMTLEGRIEAHENALQLVAELREAGKLIRAAESQGAS